MDCDRCTARDQPGPRSCGYCGATLPGWARLPWHDAALAVGSDRPLPRRYRLLQSGYREHALDADYGFVHRDGAMRPVGSLLAEWEVAADPTLNFFGESTILDYVDERVPIVTAAGGSLEEGRLRRNMLSSMPMAFSLVGMVRSAVDRDTIVRQIFGADLGVVAGAEAEWIPDRPRAELLDDRTALDAVIVLEPGVDPAPLIGIETKYTETLSPKNYSSERRTEVTELCDWFIPGASEPLHLTETNQLWRNSLLTFLAGGPESYQAVIGLREDRSLWNSVELLQAWMARPDRILARPWEDVVAALQGTSLEAFAGHFHERYLDADGPTN